MIASIIAVAGTLLGALAAGLLQHRAQRIERIATTDRQERRDQLDAVTELAVAISDHRRAMWELRDARLTNQSAERVQALRDENHRTRSTITAPAVRVRLLIRDNGVRTAADHAIKATYAMRTSTDLDALELDRQAALDAHDQLIDTTADYLN